MKKKSVVVHSGGMDSSICLALAIQEFGPKAVLSISFSYSQRHSNEIQQAQKICQDWGVDHLILSLDCLQEITESALIGKHLKITHEEGQAPNTMVVGRNGLMARLAGIHAHHLGAKCIYMGVIGVDGSHSNYPDCNRVYMDLTEKLLQIDFNDPAFVIRTPLVDMTKAQTLELADQLGVLDYLLENTITCYEGIPQKGCQVCPACLLKNRGIEEYFRIRVNS